MTQITIERTKRRHFPGKLPRESVSRFQVTESPLPAKPLPDHACPNCQRPWQDHKTTFQQFRHAFLQLYTSLVTILFAALRLVRLAVGMVLCLVGVIGFGIHNLAARVVHPEDRKLLPGVSQPTD